MKKQSFRRHSARISMLSPGVRTAGFVIFAVVLVLGLARFIAPGFFLTLSSPVLAFGSAMTDGMGAFTASFGNARELTEERDRLRAENAALFAENQELAAALVDLGKMGRTEGIVAGVIARPPVAPYDVLIVDAGRGDGAEVGLVAYGPGGTPVGVVTDVAGGYTRISLFSESGRESAGWAGRERIPVTLVGQGAGTFRLTVSKDSGLMVDDEVYLPGPGAIPVGVISRIDTDPASPEAQVRVFPYVNPFSLPYVSLGPIILP